jgi:hypothetical protein
VSKELAEVVIDPCVVPDYKLVKATLQKDKSINYKGKQIVVREGAVQIEEFSSELLSFYSKIELIKILPQLINHDEVLFVPKADITTVINDEATKFYNPSACYVGEHVIFRNATLNAENGPIIIGDGAEIMEHAVIHGPVVIHKNAKVGPHSFVRSGSVVGENSFVLGEVKNVLIMANSNKGHYGYFGDSIIGEFCNLGAGTSTSNLKNNFSNIKLFDYKSGEIKVSEELKLGSFVGDFSMTAVNTVFEAGTVIGVMANVFGEVKYPKHIPGFSWGLDEMYREDKYKKTATSLLMHKGIESSEINDLIGKLESCYLKLVK